MRRGNSLNMRILWLYRMRRVVMVSMLRRRTNVSVNQSTADKLDLSFTGRVAGWSARYRWPVVAGTLVVLIVAFLLSGSLGIKTSEVFGAGDAQKGQNLIEDRFKEFQPTAEVILFSNPNLDVGDPAFRAVVEPLVEELRGLDKVASVVSFYDAGLPFMLSEDRRALMMRLVFEPEELQTLTEEYVDPVVDAVEAADQRVSADGFEIKIAGAVSTGKEFNEIAAEDFGKIMMITLVGGLIIMVLAFWRGRRGPDSTGDGDYGDIRRCRHGDRCEPRPAPEHILLRDDHPHGAGCRHRLGRFHSSDRIRDQCDRDPRTEIAPAHQVAICRDRAGTRTLGGRAVPIRPQAFVWGFTNGLFRWHRPSSLSNGMCCGGNRPGYGDRVQGCSTERTDPVSWSP